MKNPQIGRSALKYFSCFTSTLLIALGGGCAGTSTTVVTRTTVSGDVFYETLSPYGEWVYVGSYGRVWRPSVTVVGVDFRPYGPGGHWVHTNYGWSFESDWGWGWATFHYGRWYLDPGYGWVWVPGTVWAPAWVTWRYGGGYVGWAPLAPVGAAVVVETYHPYWCFVETRHFVVRDVYHYAVPVQTYGTVFSATVTLPQTRVYAGAQFHPGPPVGQISQEIAQPIHTASVTPPPAGVVKAHQVEGVPASHHATPSSPSHSATGAPAANHERTAGEPPAGAHSAAAAATHEPPEAMQPSHSHSPEEREPTVREHPQHLAAPAHPAPPVQPVKRRRR